MTKSNNESRTKLYRVWYAMLYRCDKPNHKEYKNYGGRGITVCKSWRDFAKFKDWAMKNGYKESLTLERIDNDGNYEPKNCTWITKGQQSLNRSNNVTVTVELLLVEVCSLLGMPYDSTRKRINKGQDIQEIINKWRWKNGRKNVRYRR